MKEIFLSVLEFLGLAWWVKVVTDSPNCTYYFGPFLTAKEATAAHSGYLEDLTQEGAKGIKVVIKRCRPRQLTIFDEAEQRSDDRRIAPIFSSQL